MAQGLPEVPQGQVVEGNYQLNHREASPWDENIVGLAALKCYEEE
jgi:hypothetical protein